MDKKTTAKRITIDDMEKGEALFKSRSLYIIWRVLAGESLSEELLEHLKEEAQKTVLSDLFDRLPCVGEPCVNLKKQIFDIWLNRGEVNTTDLRKWSIQLNNCPELFKYMLDACSERKSVPAH